MQVVNYSHARNNLKSIIDTVCDNDEEVIITTKNDKTVVVLSIDEYNRTYTRIKKDIRQSAQDYAEGKIYSADEAFDIARQAIIS